MGYKLQRVRMVLMVAIVAMIAVQAVWLFVSPTAGGGILLLSLAGSLAALALDYRRREREREKSKKELSNHKIEGYEQKDC